MAPLINRTYNRVEFKWLKEYLDQRYPGAAIEFEKKLTVPGEPYFSAASGGLQPTLARRIIAKLDAFLTFPDHYEVWEAKQYAGFNAVSQLEQYKETIGSTYEGQNHLKEPITYHLLTSHAKPEVQKTAESRGIEYVVYFPAWLRQTQQLVQEQGFQRRIAYYDKLHGAGQG